MTMTSGFEAISVRSHTRALLERMWHASAPLTAVGAVMAVMAAASAVAMAVDPRIISGAPAWLKPLKFAISTSIYSLTMAWMFTYLRERPRLRRVVGWLTAVVFVVELGIIDVQALRGTTSHFNNATVLDAVLYGIMGTAIVVQTLVSVAVVVALSRQRFANRALGWALRFGMVLTVLGALSGGLMTRPTSVQVAEIRAGAHPAMVGGHTVGGADGGAGMPLTGWSREHGDLRVPHFLGLHAIQALALIAVGLRRRSAVVRSRVMVAAAASYAALFGLLLWQALRGVSLAAPDTTAVAALAVWAVSTAVVVGAIAAASRWASHGAPKAVAV
jgi:hypothetical protein